MPLDGGIRLSKVLRAISVAKRKALRIRVPFMWAAEDIKGVGSLFSSRNPRVQTSRATGRMLDEGPRKVPGTFLISNKQDKPVSTLRRR